MAIVDPAIVQRMVIALLQTVDAGVVDLVRYPGDAVEATGSRVTANRWCKLVAVDLGEVDSDRDNGGGEDAENDHHTVTITVNTFASASSMGDSLGALASVNAAVKKALHHQTVIDSDGQHQLDLWTCRASQDREADENRQICTGVVMVSGMVSRTGGENMTPLV